jgi:soluble P-type ATPase
MLTLNIPGREMLEINHLILDFNGTIALDGILIAGVAERIEALSQSLVIHVITADTNGSAADQCSSLPVSIKILESGDHTHEKGEFVKALGNAVSIGNGANDGLMFDASDIAIAVLGNEGCMTQTLFKSDIIIQNINDALDLLLKPNRMIATLRK